MTASEPESDSATYLAAVIMLYVELPETPLSASLQDTARPAVCMTAASRCKSSNRLCCWVRCAGWSDLRICRRYRRSAHSLTSSLSSMSFSSIRCRRTIWNICASN